MALVVVTNVEEGRRSAGPMTISHSRGTDQCMTKTGLEVRVVHHHETFADHSKVIVHHLVQTTITPLLAVAIAPLTVVKGPLEVSDTHHRLVVTPVVVVSTRRLFPTGSGLQCIVF